MTPAALKALLTSPNALPAALKALLAALLCLCPLLAQAATPAPAAAHPRGHEVEVAVAASRCQTMHYLVRRGRYSRRQLAWLHAAIEFDLSHAEIFASDAWAPQFAGNFRYYAVDPVSIAAMTRLFQHDAFIAWSGLRLARALKSLMNRRAELQLQYIQYQQLPASLLARLFDPLNPDYRNYTTAVDQVMQLLIERYSVVQQLDNAAPDCH